MKGIKIMGIIGIPLSRLIVYIAEVILIFVLYLFLLSASKKKRKKERKRD